MEQVQKLVNYRSHIGKLIPYIFLPAISLPISRYFLDQWFAPKWIGLYSVCLLIIFHWLFSGNIPKSISPNKKLTFVCALFLAVSTFLNWPTFILNHLLDWTSFLIIFLFFKDYFSKTSEDCINVLYRMFLIPGIIILTVGLLQLFGIDFVSGYIRNEFPSSLSGYQNRTSEFLGIFIIIQLYYYLSKNKIPLYQILLLSITSSFLILQYTRSVLLGISIVFIITLIKYFLTKKRFFITLSITTFIFSYAFLNAFNPYQNNLEVKVQNAQIRVIRWANTSQLIADNPLGIGLGNYEFNYIPYDHYYRKDIQSTEFSMVGSPHNGYLELIAEMGIGFFLAFLYFMLLLFRKIYTRLKGRHLFFILSILIFYLNISFWAFPMEIPFTFGIAPVFLGIIFREHGDLKNWNRWKKAGVASGGILYLVIVLLYTASYFFEFNKRDNYRLTKISCEIFPSNWRACIQKGVLEESHGKASRAEKTYLEILKTMPNNFVAIRQYSLLLLKIGEQDRACHYYKKYDELFDNNSSVHQYVVENCK